MYKAGYFCIKMFFNLVKLKMVKGLQKQQPNARSVQYINGKYPLLKLKTTISIKYTDISKLSLLIYFAVIASF